MELGLPPWKIFTKAIALIWEKRVFALHISLPIVLPFALLGLAYDLGIIEPLLPGTSHGHKFESNSQFLFVALLISLGMLSLGLVFLFFLAVIAVFWHRSILLGEHPTGLIPLRFDGVVWSYILYAIQTYFLTAFLGGIGFTFGCLIAALFAWVLTGFSVGFSAVTDSGGVAEILISIGVLSLSFAYLTYEGPRGGAVARKQ